MWPKGFDFFHSFMDDMHLVFLFNTIKQANPPGLTFYDLQKNGKFPAAKIYRLMKRLELDGFLIHDELQEFGKPKYLYKLSEKGEKKRLELQENIIKTFKLLKTRFPEIDPDFDQEKFIREGTFQVWCSPVEFLLQQDISDEEKLLCLTDMEVDMNQLLKKIQIEKKRLMKALGKESTDKK